MKKILLFFCVLQSLITFAQNPADIESNFGPRPGFSGGVTNMVAQPDGKIIIKGSGYRNSGSKVLIRLNPDGSVDPTFNYTHDNNFTIKCLALQSDGKLLIGGNDYYSKTWMIRLNEDGSKDTSFQIEVVIQIFSYVNSITLQPDGKILIANNSSSANLSSKYLVRLNANGGVDTTFNIGTGFDDYLKAVAVQSDGKIIVGGNFSTFRGVKETEIVRLNPDGTKDTSFITGTGFPGGGVYSIVIQNDGKIFIGGGFSSYQGVNQKYLVRLNNDGSKDTSFITPNLTYWSDQNISNMCLLPDGKLIASFYKPNGNSYGDDSVIRFNSDGSFDTTFPSASFHDGANILTGNMNADVLAIVLLNNGKILIGGKFNFCRDVIDKGIVCLNADGSRDSSFNKDTGLDDTVFCSAVQTDGKTLIGGYFDNFQGVTQKKLMRLNVDGSKDTSFNPQFQFNDKVQSLLLQSDGKILVRGKFTDYGVPDRDYLIRLNTNGTLDTSFTKRFGYDYNVEVMALQPDGKILLSGFVDSYPNLPYRKLFRLNADGSQDNTFKAGNSSDFDKTIISSIVAQPDGKILVGGSFTTFNGIAQKYLIRLNPDGSKDTSFDFGTLYDFAISVGNITLQPDGKVLVSGVLSPTSGDYQSYLIRLNSDGSKDPSFNQGIGFDNVRTGYGIGISSLILQTDGKILVGGEFDTYQGITQNRLTRLNTDGTVDSSFDAGNGFGAPVESLSLTHDGKINVGGVFSSYGGVTSSYFIRLKGTNIKPALNATTIQTNLTCPGNLTGSASIVSVYDGKSPYTYLWSNGETTATITGLAAGIYSCKITDADLSTVTKSFIIITDSDFQIPTIIAPKGVTVSTNVNCTATEVALGTPVTADNCTVASVTNNAPAVFLLGNTTVIWTVKDANNNIATATQTITVNDGTLPTIAAPSQVTVNLVANCSVTGVTLGTPVTADNCSVASVTNNAPTSFPVGNTTVTWTVKDKNNNIAKATQIVTVKDVTPPTITAPAELIVNATYNCKATGIALGTPITADNCSVASVINDAPASFPLGSTTVTWTVRDGSNNIATATQIVTVKGLDVTITNNSGVLSVGENGAIYQWMNCANNVFTVIPNQNSKTYSPSKVGSYAVEVTKNGCSVTSSCSEIAVLGIDDFDMQNKVKLYPNPTSGNITIDINSLENARLKVFDLTGRSIFSRELKGATTTLKIADLPIGVYMFRISNDTGTVTKRVVKN